MSRRKAAPKRDILPDPLFGSQLMAKFMNVVMRNGKKSVAEKIVYGALDIVVKRLNAKSAKASDDGGDEGGSKGAKLKPVNGDIKTSKEVRAFVLENFKEALDNVTPMVEVKSRRVGGSTYQVPIEIRPTRRTALAMRWMVEYAAARNEKTMIQRLANEVLDALENRGGAVRKKEDVHRMAKANQAFAHYRW